MNKGLSPEHIDAIIGERSHIPFLNTRNVLYRQMKMKLNPPSRAEAVRLMSENPNLIRRPLTISGERLVVGFVPGQLEELLEG